MDSSELRLKARALPLRPGVYLMLDDGGGVLYVGKAKQLKSRVSSYFQESADHSQKTLNLVTQIRDFNVIVAPTEFDALVMESSLIKQYQPKYNILLKDGKGYPFIRLPANVEYPRFELASEPQEGGGRYFGPFGGRKISDHVLTILSETLKLPICGRSFPREIGRGRPCLQYHMKRCIGVCQGTITPAEYNERITQAIWLLEGRHAALTGVLREDMEKAAEELRFEAAAQLRDRLNAVERLGVQQKVIACFLPDTDIIGFFADESRHCAVVLRYLDGHPVDKEVVFLEESVETSEVELLNAFIKQYYLARPGLPSEILLPLAMEDMVGLSRLLTERTGRKVMIRVPKKGSRAALLAMAKENAKVEWERAVSGEERLRRPLFELAKVLGLPAPPRRIESCDISNLQKFDRVGGLVVFVDGRSSKRDYKRFEIKEAEADDLSAMREMLRRRFLKGREGAAGFDELPDLLLVDGGALQAGAALRVVQELGYVIPVCGMVKDGRHRTRALVDADGREADLRALPGLYAFIGRVQEETHRFAITYHRQKRDKKMRKSELDGIAGIGEKRKMALLREFKSVGGIRKRSIEELCAVIPQRAAQAVWEELHKAEKQVEQDSHGE